MSPAPATDIDAHVLTSLSGLDLVGFVVLMMWPEAYGKCTGLRRPPLGCC